MNYTSEKVPQECEDRAYWDKRFNFASWLFLFFAFYFIIFTDNGTPALFSIAISFGYRAVNTVLQIRHMKWHMRGGSDAHL